MNELLEKSLSLRVSETTFDKAKDIADASGSKKSVIDRMAYLMGLELIQAIQAEHGDKGLAKELARESIEMIRRRHYNEVKNELEE